LAQQAAIALENARTYEALALLNARLEDRVRDRTAQLEEANRELAQAYGELKRAETRLVHSEKMASLGRLVAGVAHEINNPVSFISTSVAPLTRRLQQAAGAARGRGAGRHHGARRGAHGGDREGPAQLLPSRRSDAQGGRSARGAR